MARKATLGEALGGDEEPGTTATARPTTKTPQRKTTGRSRPAQPIKLTIELSSEQHRALKSFALLQADDASLAEVVRASIAVLNDNQKFAKAVIDEIKRSKQTRR